MTEHLHWQLVPIEDLHESPVNPRFITDDAFERLQRDLKTAPQMMEARPVIADADKGGEILAGNMRHRAATAIIEQFRRDGEVNGYIERFGEKIPAFVRTFANENERREWMLRDNNDYGDWQEDALSAMVREHQEQGGDIHSLGFHDEALNRLIEQPEPPPPGEDDDPSNQTIPEVWGVIVDCETEHQQVELLERLESEGFDVRALIS